MVLVCSFNLVSIINSCSKFSFSVHSSCATEKDGASIGQDEGISFCGENCKKVQNHFASFESLLFHFWYLIITCVCISVNT
jgi:hypothetical protein